MSLRAMYKGIKKVLAPLIINRPGELAIDQDALNAELNTVFFPRSEQAVLGAKNLLENTAITQTVSNVVFTVNDDKTISLAQTASANAVLQVGIAHVKAGTYRIYSGFKGSGTTGNFTGVGIMVNKTEGAYDYYLIDQDYVDVTLDADGYIVYKIRIISDTDTTGFKIYPMITLGSNTDPTYVPYALTNKELTDKFANSSKYICTWGNYISADTEITLTESIADKVKIGFVCGANNVSSGVTMHEFDLNRAREQSLTYFTFIHNALGVSNYFVVELTSETKITIKATDMTTESGNYGIRRIYAE